MASLAAALVVVASLAACAAPATDRRPADVNLNGYPPAFKAGYADGCESARGTPVRDERRLHSDPQYATGWRDGYDLCGRRSRRVNATPRSAL